MARRRSTVDIRPLIEKLKRVPGAMEKTLKPLVEQEARLFLKGGKGKSGIVDITPPASAGVFGVKAKKQGEAAVARDIYRVYATASQAMQAIKAVDPEAAKTFWALFRTGDYTAAGEILRNLGGRPFQVARSFAPFDNGVLHQRFRGKKGRITRNRVTVVVTDAAELRTYVKKMQGRVGLLASGWLEAANELGVRLPAWVSRHGQGHGGVSIELGADKMMIVISNKVKYGAANDLQRRVDYVMKYRKAALKRRLPYVIKAALKKAGFRSGRAAA